MQLESCISRFFISSQVVDDISGAGEGVLEVAGCSKAEELDNAGLLVLGEGLEDKGVV